jgi:hypothetical protein
MMMCASARDGVREVAWLSGVDDGCSRRAARHISDNFGNVREETMLASGLGMISFAFRHRSGCSKAGLGMRPGGWLYWIIVGLSGLTFALVVTYIVLVQDNRSVQAEVNQRQQFINQSIQLGRVNEALIRALATTAVSSKDDKLRELLTQNGITINAAGDAVPAASKPAAESTPATPGTAR